MKCPKCGERGYVYTTLSIPGKSETKRYRRCQSCGYKWHTLETVGRTDEITARKESDASTPENIAT